MVKENQILQKGDTTIDNNDENATLVDVNIFAGDQIIVRDSEIHENRDIAGNLFDNCTSSLYLFFFFPFLYTKMDIFYLCR